MDNKDFYILFKTIGFIDPQKKQRMEFNFKILYSLNDGISSSMVF